MGIRLHQEPNLSGPVMLCGWPGIGGIGLAAIETLRRSVGARLFAEIEPWEFFGPKAVVIEAGILKELRFPTSRFYAGRLGARDVIFFVGEQQPADSGAGYAKGRKAYDMANMVVELGERLGCRRFYTSGAAVTRIHHTARSRVWAVPNDASLLEEVRGYDNTILTSAIEGRGRRGTITGLNGLLLGVAKKRGHQAICLMGEIPYYLQAIPWQYPRGSKAVLELLARIFDTDVDLGPLDELAGQVDENVERFLESLSNAGAIPPRVRDEIERLRQPDPEDLGPITDEEQKEILDHIDELFRQGGWHDER